MIISLFAMFAVTSVIVIALMLQSLRRAIYWPKPID